MLDFLKNLFFNRNRYRTDSESVIIACYFNPQRSPYRSKAFKTFYNSIKHLNYRIVECVIGDAEPELDINTDCNITQVHTESMLWHKEGLLNGIIKKLPKKFKYVFWVDADVIFTNLNWLVDGAKQLETCNIIQPFDICVHLEQDELTPSFDLEEYRNYYLPNEKNKKVWRSFCSNYVFNSLWASEKYDDHGHVGFAWGARREILDKVPLYDKALIGGADHIIAHAAAGQIGHKCITKSFTDNIEDVNWWSSKFASAVNEKIGCVRGGLYHIWHGDIEKRQYLKRIQDFTSKSKNLSEKDDHGLYIADEENDTYVRKYFKHREVPGDDEFLTSMAIGYATDNSMVGGMVGGNMMGAIIGDMLNTDDQQIQTTEEPQFEGFGGGKCGGAGAGGTWDDNDNNGSDTFLDNPSNENFS